jgi:hypothetical protein
MTSVITDLPRQYRARAEEAPVRAELAGDGEIRNSLLQIAETWDRMGRYEEQHHPAAKSMEGGTTRSRRCRRRLTLERNSAVATSRAALRAQRSPPRCCRDGPQLKRMGDGAPPPSRFLAPADRAREAAARPIRIDK